MASEWEGGSRKPAPPPNRAPSTSPPPAPSAQSSTTCACPWRRPEDPGDGRYEVFTPLFDKVVLPTVSPYASGKPFTVVARNNAPGPRYIQKASLNGQPLERCWITHAELAKGGTLVLLGPEPSPWGRN